MGYGTYSTLDVFESANQSVVEFGINNAWDGVRTYLEAYNRTIAQMSGELWVTSTDTRRAYGGGATKTMERLDQFGQPSAQKISAGQPLDFPLDRFGIGAQYTMQALEMMSTQQLAADLQAAVAADRNEIIKAAKRALYTASNSTVIDYLGRPAGITLNVKALVNNDGMAVPPGPNGEPFPGTHQHYLGNATLTAAAVTNLLTTVQEHYNTGTPVMVISSTDETAFRALAGFTAVLDANVIRGGGATTDVTRGSLDTANLYDRFIGRFLGAEVWVKWWAIANYVLCYMRDQTPLVMRQPIFAPAGDLRLVSRVQAHPLLGEAYERQFGMGVWQRTAAAVLYFANATYASPTI